MKRLIKFLYLSSVIVLNLNSETLIITADSSENKDYYPQSKYFTLAKCKISDLQVKAISLKGTQTINS